MHSTGFILTSGILSVVLLVVLIARFKLHPFIALLASAVLLGLVNGLEPNLAVSTFTDGFGKTLGVTGVVIALGTILGAILLKSGGADRIADVLIGNKSKKWIPISMGLTALIIGLPNLFEVTFVLLVPLVYSVARRLNVNLLFVGIPMAAGLMTAHGLLPPGPAPLLGAAAYHASVGLVFLFGAIVAVPVLLSGVWLFPRLIAHWNITGADGALGALGAAETPEVQEPPSAGGPSGSHPSNPLPIVPSSSSDSTGGHATVTKTRSVARSEPANPVPAHTIVQPALAHCLVTVLLAPALMIIGTLTGDEVSGGWPKPLLDAAGNPVISLFLAAAYAYVFLGLGTGQDRNQLLINTKHGLSPIINLLLIVGAGGGLKGTLAAIGLSGIIADSAKTWAISPILFAWLIAAIFRIALGSGTVAVATATGIVAPIAAAHGGSHAALLVLATCTGAMIFSHVSDGAFWLFKEYFGLTVTDTFRTWSFLVTVQSVVGLVSILGVDAVLSVI